MSSYFSSASENLATATNSWFRGLQQDPALVNPNVVNFLIFNPTITNKEDKAEENIFFYYPPEANLNAQMNDAGLATAMSGLLERFTESPLRTYSTSTTRVVLHQPEPNFWMVITLRRTDVSGGPAASPDSSTMAAAAAGTATATAPPTNNASAGPVRGAAASESYMEGGMGHILRQGYDLFALRHGTFTHNLQAYGREMLAGLMQSFFSVFTLHVFRALASFDPLLEALDGLTYLPADRMQFLSVVTLLNRVRAAAGEGVIDQCLVVVDEAVVYTELHVRDTHTLSRFVRNRRILQRDEAALPHMGDNVTRLAHTAVRDSMFLQGGRPMQMWLRRLGDGCDRDSGDIVQLEERAVLLFAVDNSTYLFFVLNSGGSGSLTTSPTSSSLERRTTSCISTYNTSDMTDCIRQNTSATLSGLKACLSRSTAFDDSFYYAYLNNVNLAVKTSLRKKAPLAECLHFAESVHAKFVAQPDLKEFCVKLKENVWVMCMRSGEREFYVVLDKVVNGLAEVGEDVKHIASIFFKGIFI
eukprot:PhM_4_TR3198/c0_g1_i1/m.8059